MSHLKLLLCIDYVNFQTLVFLMILFCPVGNRNRTLLTFKVRNMAKMATPCLRRLVAGLLLLNPGFHPGPVDVIFGTGTGFSRSTSVIRTTLHNHHHSHTTLHQN
jgi:hypothetical protein